MASEWPLEIGGREFQPVPESWIEHGYDADVGQSPRVYAVSATTDGGRGLIIRYGDPQSGYVTNCSTGVEDGGDGVYPAALSARSSDWPRSLVPTTGPDGTLRGLERERLHDLWADRVDAIEPRVVADGGQFSDDTNPDDGGEPA